MTGPTGAAAEKMQQLWAVTVDRVKQQVVSTSLYRALEKAVPIAWEEGSFVVGLGTMDGQHSGVLNTSDYQTAIERALQNLSGQSGLRFRVIEGTHYSDWEYAKKRDAAARANQAASFQKQVAVDTAFSNWDDVYERVSRLWATYEHRNIATGRGRYLDEAVGMVVEAMETLYPAEGKGDDLTERGLSRVIERVAMLVQADVPLVSYLIFQRHKSVVGSR
jgi:hypothetical protein